MLRYRGFKIFFFTDTLMALTIWSTRAKKYTQLYFSDKGFVIIYPMKSQSEFNDTLHYFCKEMGVLVSLVMDGHMSQKNNKTKKFCHQVGMTLHILEAGTPWANHAELHISIFKEVVRRNPCMTNALMVL